MIFYECDKLVLKSRGIESFLSSLLFVTTHAIVVNCCSLFTIQQVQCKLFERTNFFVFVNLFFRIIVVMCDLVHGQG